MEISAANRRFLNDRTERGCNPATVRWYRDVLSLFERDSGVVDVEGITLDVLRAYVVHLQSKAPGLQNARMSPVTIRKKVLALKTFCAWLKGAGLLPLDPAAELSTPKAPRRLPRAMSPDQARAFLSVPMNTRDRAIVAQEGDKQRRYLRPKRARSCRSMPLSPACCPG